MVLVVVVCLLLASSVHSSSAVRFRHTDCPTDSVAQIHSHHRMSLVIDVGRSKTSLHLLSVQGHGYAVASSADCCCACIESCTSMLTATYLLTHVRGKCLLCLAGLVLFFIGSNNIQIADLTLQPGIVIRQSVADVDKEDYAAYAACLVNLTELMVAQEYVRSMAHVWTACVRACAYVCVCVCVCGVCPEGVFVGCVCGVCLWGVFVGCVCGLRL